VVRTGTRGGGVRGGWRGNRPSYGRVTWNLFGHTLRGSWEVRYCFSSALLFRCRTLQKWECSRNCVTLGRTLRSLFGSRVGAKRPLASREIIWCSFALCEQKVVQQRTAACPCAIKNLSSSGAIKTHGVHDVNSGGQNVDTVVRSGAPGN